jgi:hypothetical protein
MNWEQFIGLISKEKEEDVVVALVYTKKNYYEFSPREVRVMFGKDENTQTYSNYSNYRRE